MTYAFTANLHDKQERSLLIRRHSISARCVRSEREHNERKLINLDRKFMWCCRRPGSLLYQPPNDDN